MITVGLMVALVSPIGNTVGDPVAIELTVDASHPEDPVAARARARERADAVCERLGVTAAELGGEPLRFTVYGTHEAKGLATGDVRAFSADESGAVALVLDAERVSRPDGRAEALAVLQRVLGPPTRPALLDGAVAFLGSAESWQEARQIAAWVVRAGEATPFEALLDADAYGGRSHLIQEPLAAVAVAALWEMAGIGGWRSAWRGEFHEIAAWRDAYNQSLARLTDEFAGELEEHRRGRRAAFRRTGLRGFCFGHEGYRIHNGYLSRQAQRSLERARELGANTVSITPFGFYRRLAEPLVRWSPTTQRAGNENDEAVLVAGARAKALGMATMLKPHLWSHVGWCGEIAMADAADWDAWFASYGEFLAHHALLAELGGYDWLAIGCELVQTTREHGDRWRALATRARRLFAGGITYAANWGEEAQGLTFADALDAVGVNHYDPLSQADAPTATELAAACQANLRALTQLAQQYGRPVIITELGFPARHGAWRDPYRGEHRGERDPGAQERCYRALVSAFQDGAPLDVDGVYIWKWPTLLDWPEERADYWPASPAVRDQLRVLFAR